MEIHQFSCVEGNKIDLRQANAVLNYAPDIIICEAPSNHSSADLVFNPNDPVKKQKQKIESVITELKKIAKKYPWAASDIQVYKNIMELSKQGHKIKMYNVDAPSELLKETINHKWDLLDKPRRRGSVLLWWVYIYLREKIMTKNIRPLFKKSNLNVLIFLQKFHWLNVNFLLSNPSKDKIWQYYFGRFKGVDVNNISETIKLKNIILYKFWLKYSDFI